MTRLLNATYLEQNCHITVERQGCIISTKDKQFTVTSFFNSLRKFTSSQSEKITQPIADMIVSDYILSNVEGQWFHGLMQLIAPPNYISHVCILGVFSMFVSCKCVVNLFEKSMQSDMIIPGSVFPLMLEEGLLDWKKIRVPEYHFCYWFPSLTFIDNFMKHPINEKILQTDWKYYLITIYK
jgi:hypothetical protein